MLCDLFVDLTHQPKILDSIVSWQPSIILFPTCNRILKPFKNHISPL
uniref:Uncharacterized protein n=1 Tax=Rhizophora mucronata TaxID=61149 RepID=A0A2P2N0F4_RHIMU